MVAAVFSDVSPRSPRHGLHSVAAGNAKGTGRVRPHRPFGVSACGADRVSFVFLFWCLFLETVWEVCNLHNIFIIFFSFCLLTYILFHGIILSNHWIGLLLS